MRRKAGQLHPSVSIIVPVFNDEDRLVACLERLDQQSYPRDRFEVIVADNGSACNVQALVSRYPRTSFVSEKRPGSYAARNAGLAIATGEIIGFTDSDCLPQNDWVARGVASLQRNPGAGLVGGRVVLFPRDPQKLTHTELYQQVSGFPQQQYIEEKQFAVTANLFTFRKVLDDVGFFEGALKSNGDKHWGQRVFDSGYLQVYAEDAVVEHPSRRNVVDLARKKRRITGGRVQVYELKGEPQPALSSELRRLTFPRMDRLERFGDHPLLRSRTNRARFLTVDYLIQLAELFEVIRLRLGGRPRRK